MKNNQDKEFKRWLKNKLSVTQALMIHFLITGSLSMFGLAAMSLSSNVAYGALNDTGAGSTSSVAIGEGSIGNGDRSVAIGKGAHTTGFESIAIGNDSKTTSNNNIAIGKGARAEGNNNSMALGNGAVVTGNDGALAIGRDSKAGGRNNIAIGRESETTSNESMALGYQAKAKSENAVAVGREANATGNKSVAIGMGALSSNNSTVALGENSKATGSGSTALSVQATASGNNAVAISYNSKATAARTIAIGEGSNASSDDGIALGFNTQATSGSSVAIGRDAISSSDSTVALGKQSRSTGRASLALGTGSNATGNDGYAIGWESDASAESTMAFGHSSKARKNYDIALGRGAETRNQGGGHSVAIGYGAISGSNRVSLDRNGTDAGSVAIGTGAYTGVNRDYISLNSSVAIGAGAGAGFRNLDTNNNNMPVGNATDVDNNEEVLKKAFGVKNVNDYVTIAEGANGYTNVDINEATALGRNARAIGDQSVAIGAQTIAGHGAVALGGNDITQFAGKKYYKSTKENFNVTETTDHNQDAVLSDRTISDTYRQLVGTALDTSYKATYAQDGSVVLGMQAHSGTPLGTAIGTNSLIRKGAFGATAIGAGSQIQANAEAAVAIGMGSRANGSYAVAAGTASLAELGDVAIGYHAEATGKEGAISIGQATKAQGDSSVMIGGANIASASTRNTEFINEKQDSTGAREIYYRDITETINGKKVVRRYSYVTLEDKSDTIEKAYATLTGTPMNKAKLEYDKEENKNGHASTSVGVHSLAKGDLASAFGASSRANAIGSLALGTGAQALVQNAVAIGTGSIAGDPNYKNAGYDVTKSDPVIMGTRQLSVSYDKDGKIVSDSDVANIAYTFIWAGGENTAPGDIVSFGKKGAERQLKHVAAGRIAENSTDAVNGSQLNAIIERFVGDKIKYFSVKSDAQGNHYNDGATGKDSIAIGPDATATKDNATATGNKSKVSEENATAYGYNTEATGKSSVALGTSAIKPGTTTLVTTEASGENSTALGVASKAKGQDSIALGYGVEANNNFATAIGSEATVTADKGIAIGKKASTTVEGGIALGTDSVASVAGAQTGISVDGEVEGARTNVYENLKNNVNNSKISGNNGAVSVGSSTATRQIVNLAAGTNDTDAVNVAQLKSVNLAFKGNTGTGDVRLHDQRLAVESSNTDLLTVEASDKKLTFKPKTATLNIDNTIGSDTLGKVVVPTTDGLVKASELANTLNNMYWNVATSKSDTAPGAKHTGETMPQSVKPGETVNFIAGDHVTIGQKGKNITISMKDAITQVQLNNTIKTTFENGKNTTLVTNDDGSMRYSLDDDISLNTVKTGTTVVSDGKVSGLNDNLTNTENKVNPDINKSEPVKKAELPNTSTAVNKKNAATVGDVLNAGWNLQNNGEAKDFVRPYDTVNFVDGINTKAVVTTDEEGKISKVTYNVVGLPIKYTDATGNPVTKVGDKYYKTDGAGNVLDKNGNPVTKYDTNGNPLNADDTAVNPVNDVKTNLVNTKPGTDKTDTTDPTTLGNVKSGLDTIKNTDGTTNPNSANKTAGLVNLNTPNISDNNAATVGDLRNMGWVVSAEGNSYNAQVKNANEVNFVGKNGLNVTGKTEANGVRTITIENSHSPITYTDENGNKLRKVGDNFYPENAVVNNGNVYPEGSVVIDGEVYPEGTTKAANGDKVKKDGNPAVVATPIANTPSEKVKATLNSVTPNKPTTLSNVGSNLKQVVDPNGTNPGSVKNPDGSDVSENGASVTVTNKAPYTASEAADIANKLGNNAATVADVLNAGWNLQGNGKAVDFVKPYDTVNFRDGGNTTITYETNGTTSHMQVNVTGLPVTNTITDPTSGKQVPLVKVGDTYYPAKTDGTPNIKKDEHGNPTNGYTIADDGNIYNSGDITFGPEQANGTKTKTNNPDAKPVTINSNMSNPNVTTDSKNAVNTPTQLGNVANGAKTHNPIGADGTELKQANDGNYYPATKVNPDGSLAIDAGNGMTYPPVKPIEMGNDGKWYEKDKLDSNGNPKQGATEVPNPLKNVNKAGLVDFTNSNSNNVATVGDLRNMGWVVSSNKTTDDLETAYNDQVRNANEVKFVGTGMATVSGKTVDSIRTITVDVNAQKTVETAQVPIVYTDNAGNKLTKIGDKFYNVNDVPEKPVKHDGDLYPTDSVIINGKVYPVGSRLDDTGKVIDRAGVEVGPENPIKYVNKSDVKASMNNGDNTTKPTTLSNVGNNLKQVVDPNGTTPGGVKNPDGSEVTENGAPVTVTNKAPYTASEAADIVKNVGNNAATVGDVLNAGWNLQNNGEARDFVKPYDTVNFINGGNTTAVVTTNAEGTTSNVTYNVTGLPVTYTNEDGKPVSKVGDNYYLVNDKGQPLQDNGTPVTKYDPNGNPLNDDETPVRKVDTTAKPLKTNLVNPNVATDKQTTTPTQLGNVANGAGVYNNKVDDKGNPLTEVDGKYYTADKFKNGKLKENASETAPNVANSDKFKGLSNLTNAPDSNVATIGDIKNLGWVVSSDKTTEDLEKAYNDQVRNANEVKFVGIGTAIVSGKTVDGVRTITVEVNDQLSTNNSVTAVVYTKADGTKVYPKEVTNSNGTKEVKFYPNPDGTGTEIPKEEVITSANGPKGTTTPSVLSNIASNLDGAKTGTTSPTTNADLPNTTDKAGNNYINPNNAATVGDVLNAGWNLQANKTAVDFVKPYDTVNFVDGIGTTVEATSDNKVSHIKFHTVARYSDENGTPIKKDSTDGKYYSINPDGTLNKTVPGIDNPQINLVNGNPGKNPDGTPKEGTTVPTILSNLANGSNPTYTDGKGNTLVKVGDSYYKEDQLNDDGKPKDGATPSTDNPLKMGTDGKWYPADSISVNGKYYPADTVVINGKPYEPGTVNVNGKPYPAGTVVIDGKPYEAGTIKDKDTGRITKDGNDATPLTTLKDPITTTIEGNTINNPGKAGLSDLSKSKETNAATIGDLKNMGWVVSSDKTTGDLGTEYNDQVRNANEVKFVGTGMATVSGKTVDNIRTITVDVNAQKTVESAQIPVVYTDNDGNKLTKVGDKFYNVNDVPEGVVSHNGNLYPAGSVVSKDGNVYPQGTTLNENGAPTVAGTKPVEAITPVNNSDVKASMNSGDNTTSPTTLSNVLGNLPQVNDKDKTVNKPDGKPYKKDENIVTGNDKAPITAEEAADIVKKSGNNAATVGDVLNAGWNLQGNGKAVDFVKPYDTVNFVDGIGTTVEAKVDEKGTTSTVKINTVMQYTDKEGNPVKKAENGKYYKESDLAGKVYDKATNTFKNENGSELTEQPKAVNNPQVNIVNAEPDTVNNKTATTTPTQLGNVANGSETYAAPEVNGEKVVQAKDGKWYKETDVVNGTANENATEVTTPINPGKSGLVDFSKSNPTNVATVGDLQNLGWVVSSDKTTGALGKEYNDQVRNANEVKFIGKNGIQVSGKTDDKGVRTLTFEMEPGEITPTEIVKPDDNKLDKKVVAIGNKVYNAEDIDTNGKPKKDAVPVGTIVDGKVYDNKDLNVDGKPNDNASPIAKVKENDGAKFVTGNQVADAIEKSGFIVGKNQGLSESDFENKDEKINPNDELRFADGRNTNVKLATKDVIDATGKVKTVTTVKVDVVDLPITYTDESGKVVVKGKDGKFYYPEALDGKVYDEKEKTYKNPDGTALAKQPEAKENIQANLVNPNVSNTDTEPNKQTTTPTQLGNVANGANTFAKEGKQIANDGKWYNEGDVLPNGKPKENVTAVEKPENVGKAGLIDFEKSKPNNAATVGDLQNLGWVVSSDKTTGNTSKPYNDQVRNSNEVKFVGKNGIQVSGKTDDNGVRTLTFEMETGEIIPTEIIKADGKTKLIKVGDKAYNPEDIGTDGKAKDGVKPVGTIAKDGNVYNVTDVDDKGNVITQEGKPTPTPIATNTPNNGTKFVTGNQVADALEKSGFVVGKNNNELSAADFENKDEKLNPNDELRFADGRNTNVKLATKEVIDASGKVKTVTTVKVDVEGLPITYTNKDGKPIVKKGDKFYLLDDKGNATDTEVKADDIKTNLVAPNSKPNEIGTPQSLGNVASGLKAADIKTEVNKSDDKKVVKDLIDTKENDKKLNTAANLDDLKTLSKAGLDFGANVGNDVHRNLGEKVSILGNDKVTKEDANDETKFSSKNVVTTTGKNSINIKFSQNPEFDSIKIGNRENKPVVTISSEGIDAGNTKITNVAPGEISDTSQDAINGSQLSGVLKGINAGIASSVAMANLPQVSNIGMHRHNIAAAIGIHRGESAFALGLSGLNHRGTLVYKASGALNTKGHVTFGVGLGYQFDLNTRDNDTHRNDIIDLKEKLEDVIRENSEYKQEIQEYRKEQEQNKAIIEQLMKRLEALEKTK